MDTRTTPPSPHIARLREAMVELQAAASENVTRSQSIMRRIGRLDAALASGRALSEIVREVDAAGEPLVVELVTSNIDTLQRLGSRFRAAQAHALRAEGMTIQTIANLFGVTRQRISALLRQHPQ